MREIKFRAWDNDSHKWLFEYQHLVLPIGKMTEYADDKHWTLSQYTGLKDKNDREIYEGDIVKCSTKYKDDKYTGAVEWGYSRWEVPGFYEGTFDDPSDAFSEADMQVIGNIYESPDLLPKP